MPKRIIADPEGGFRGKMENKVGTWVQGTYRLVAYVYAQGEVVPDGIDRATIAELRERYWNSERRAMVIPFPSRGPHRFEFGSKLLSQVTDTTVVHVRPEFSYEGPPPTECSCGTLPFRHAVSYHQGEDARAAGAPSAEDGRPGRLMCRTLVRVERGLCIVRAA